MKKRLVSIMDTSRKSKWLALACVMAVIIVSLLSCNAVDAAQRPRQYIDEDTAKYIALGHAGVSEQEAVFVKARLGPNNRRAVYDIEFYSGNTEYDYEIDAINGKILEYDRDIENYPPAQNPQNPSPGHGEGQYIGKDEAKSIALSDAGFSERQARRMRVKLDREFGRMVYEVDFRSDGIKFEYEIDAVSGEILKSDFEYN